MFLVDGMSAVAHAKARGLASPLALAEALSAKPASNADVRQPVRVVRRY